MNRSRLASACLAVATTALLASCTADNSAATGPRTTINVSSTADACTLSDDTAPSGTVVFKVTNDGDQTTELYLYAADGKEVIAEVENIGPGLTRDLVADLEPGQYVPACKPGMKGDGIRSDFTVTKVS